MTATRTFNRELAWLNDLVARAGAYVSDESVRHWLLVAAELAKSHQRAVGHHTHVTRASNYRTLIAASSAVENGMFRLLEETG